MNQENLNKILEKHKLWTRGMGGARADLSRANLRGANMSVANMSGADMSGANMIGANISGANMSGANLREANLIGANLIGANLSGAKYSIFCVLRSNWMTVSDSLCLEMMRWDALSCGDYAMRIWVDTGVCPFENSEREFYFKENKKLWVPGKPQMNHRDLFIALCAEKNIKL